MNDKVTIGLTGHGTGGHFYPLIAVGESVKKISPESKLVYFGPDKYDAESLSSIDSSEFGSSNASLPSSPSEAMDLMLEPDSTRVIAAKYVVSFLNNFICNDP